MSTEMLFWFIIVGVAIIAIIGYFIYNADKLRGRHFHYIDIDHYDIYCDDDDCDD
ncbi:MAG: hypothetical protein K1V87_10260 [Muribaculum sp.]